MILSAMTVAPNANSLTFYLYSNLTRVLPSNAKQGNDNDTASKQSNDNDTASNDNSYRRPLVEGM